MTIVLRLKAKARCDSLDETSVKMLTAKRVEMGLMEKVRQLEADKAALEGRITHLAENETATNFGFGAELEQSQKEVCRMQQQHEAAAKQVIITDDAACMYRHQCF